MVHASSALDALVRQAFGLIIEMRHQEGAARSLALAIPYLRMLANDSSRVALPFVISVTAMPIHENHPGSASKPRPKQRG